MSQPTEQQVRDVLQYLYDRDDIDLNNIVYQRHEYNDYEVAHLGSRYDTDQLMSHLNIKES